MYYVSTDTNSFVSFNIYNHFESVLVAIEFMDWYIKKYFDGWTLEVNDDKTVWKVTKKNMLYEFRILECEKSLENY